MDGEANEQCDSRLFLLDIVDPKADWREGESLPGDCAVGQTMDTVVIPHAKGAKVSQGEGGGYGVVGCMSR